jgi:hypothetical protein
MVTVGYWDTLVYTNDRGEQMTTVQCIPLAHSCVSHLKYGMDCAEYGALRARAQGHCEICGLAEEETPTGALVIDHAHDYGDHAVRGLLCSACNSKLGAAEYWNNPTQRQHDKQIGPYLANAWFMQVLRWARNSDGLLGIEDAEGQRLADSALRQPVIRSLTKALNAQPRLASYMEISRGRTVFHFTASYELPSGALVVADLEHRSGRKFVNDHVGVTVPGSPPVRLPTSTAALALLRSLVLLDEVKL